MAAIRLQALLDPEEPPGGAGPPGRRPGGPRAHPTRLGDPRWGAPRIHGQLLKLGLEISQATVSKYLVRRRTPPSQTWRTFLANHVGTLVSVDFFVVPTVLFKVLLVFVVLAHDRRRVVHVYVTDTPTAQWTAQQLVEAFPWDTAPRYLLRDRDAVYEAVFSSRVRSLGIHEVKIAPRSPWQNPYVERLIGTLRRECLDHVVVLNESHLRRLLHAYLGYYHGTRTHLSLDKDAPEPRPVERPDRPNAPDRRPPSSLPPASGVSSCLRAVPTTLTSPVGACASVHGNPLLDGSARSQGGPCCVSVVSEAYDQEPQPVPRYLDRLNGRDTGSNHGSLEDKELMAECEVLEGDGRRPKKTARQNVHKPITSIMGHPGLRHGV